MARRNLKGRHRRKGDGMVKRRKNGPTTKSLNKKIKRIENEFIETKFFDVYNAGTTIALAGIQDLLVGIAQGDTASTRTGNVIVPSSVQLRMAFSSDIDELSSSRIRIMLFWDRQPNGAVPVLTGAPTISSLLDTGTITQPVLAPRKYNAIELYSVLYDKILTLTPGVVLTTAAGATTQVVLVDKQINLIKKLHRSVKYNDTTGVIGSIVTNSLYIAYFSDNANALLQPSLQAGYRLYYRDA